MPRFSFRIVAVVGVALFALLVVPSASWAGGPGKWTKLATIDNSYDTFGMLRTGNGDLHLAWLAKKASNGTFAYDTSTISPAGALLGGAKTVLSGWSYLEPDPQLVKNGSGLRLVFEGNKGSSGSCYFDASVFTATSATGSAWSLASGSMDHDTVGVGNLAATAESNGTPVATFGYTGGGHFFHVGVDPSCPATSADGTVPVASGNVPNNPSIVTASNGIWVGTFQSFASGYGYFVTQILPSAGPSMEAPGSHGTGGENNQPLEPVALAARVGGGVYMAYCVVSSSQPCAHIDLWKVGSSTAKVVPGSANTTGARLALAAGPGGRVAVAWYNEAKNVIHAVRTNTAGTAFGVVRTIKPPANTTGFNDIQAQDSTGRMDVMIDAQIHTGTTFPQELLQTQILPGLSLHANPSSFSHKKAATVTFTVGDAGQPVSGAKVSCLGKTGTTAGTGQVKLKFGKGTATGKHACTATKAGYAPGKTTLTVK